MTTAIAMPAPTVKRLDLQTVRRGMFFFALLNFMIAPFTPDPLAYGMGAFTPFVILSIMGQPTMPKGLIFFILWQWGQTFSRALQSLLDGESMASGVYGADVLRAYWYVLASLITLALAFRLVLGRIPPPTVQEYYAHERWRAVDLTMLYLAGLIFAVIMGFIGRSVSGLDQPAEAAARVKVVALFLLCAYVFTTGRGGKMLLGAVFFEILVGFTGFQSDFRAVFFYIAFAALAARIKWTGTATVAAVIWLTVLLTLALFWTSVKADYRDYVTQSDETTQAIKIPLEERMAYLGDKALNIGETNWGETAYMLLIRFAYIDIFGQVIGVAESSPPEPQLARQWKEGLLHVLQPRFLFPDKAGLSDTEVYMRLARADPLESIRLGTSISVGYIAENYADLGFPGMLAGIFAIGVLLALVVRYFMSRPLPWMLREGIIMGFAFTVAGTGMEISLPKLFGATLMFFLVWSLIVKFGLPFVLRWLDQRADAAGPARPVRS